MRFRVSIVVTVEADNAHDAALRAVPLLRKQTEVAVTSPQRGTQFVDTETGYVF